MPGDTGGSLAGIGVGGLTLVGMQRLGQPPGRTIAATTVAGLATEAVVGDATEVTLRGPEAIISYIMEAVFRLEEFNARQARGNRR